MEWVFRHTDLVACTMNQPLKGSLYSLLDIPRKQSFIQPLLVTTSHYESTCSFL